MKTGEQPLKTALDIRCLRALRYFAVFLWGGSPAKSQDVLIIAAAISLQVPGKRHGGAFFHPQADFFAVVQECMFLYKPSYKL